MPKQKSILLALVLPLVACSRTPRTTPPPAEPLRCELQTEDRRGGDILDPKLRNHLHFILFSDRDGLRVFSEWNMWGYFARTFTLTDSNSNQYRVTSRDVPFDGNFPGSISINRGEVLVTDVYLCDGSWMVSPKLPLERAKWAVTGHFSLKQEADPTFVSMFKTNEVWHGTIDSPPAPVDLTKECVSRLNAEHLL